MCEFLVFVRYDRGAGYEYVTLPSCVNHDTISEAKILARMEALTYLNENIPEAILDSVLISPKFLFKECEITEYHPDAVAD